jgi:hypothetical protein
MEYLYYRLWQLLKGKSEEDMAPFGSTMIFWMLLIANIRTIELLIHHFLDFGYTPKDKNGIVLYSLIPISIVFIFSIFYFFKRRNRIKLKYENESKLKKIVGTTVLFSYGFISLIALFIVGNKYPIE